MFEEIGRFRRDLFEQPNEAKLGAPSEPNGPLQGGQNPLSSTSTP